jgi:phosphatidylglycerophosphate synthase
MGMKFNQTYLYRCANNPYIRFPKPWDTYLTLPLSLPISELLSRTRVKPNTISVISLLVAVIAACFFYCGSYLCLIIGAIIFHISYILDCADGYIARKNNMASKFGHWIDHTFDEIKKPVLLVGLLMGQDALDSVAPWGWIAALLYIFSRVLVKTDNTVKAAPGANSNKLEATGGSKMMLTPRQRWLFEKFGIVTLFTSIEGQAIVFVVGPVFNAPLTGILVSAAVSILWFVYVDGYRYWRRYFQSKENQKKFL